ncbi:MAG: HD domain-containing protein [Sutterellaceae bacterium]|nr:HD domain-containing protein [Burkholderiaceae bacterium]MCX7901631.1 HD domain-containing protein [Burkholderiaceae bacterium]MDW8430922.1 HD domain-containing protein [Sutterellaceae bacterium]
MTAIEIESLHDLYALLQRRGDEQYTGEPVTHRAHALQCAWLAARAGAPDTMVVAALLHDIGHLLSGWPGTPSADGIDDRHEDTGAWLLSRWFGPEVTEPIRLHVPAKRVLAAEPAYCRALSEDSQRSLRLQGGVLTGPAREAFFARPYAQAALALRRWDEAAKKPGIARWELKEAWAVVEQVHARVRRFANTAPA